ncbi:MAG: EAL domain-containing protein [Peptococcaceae bacterium]
MIAKRQILIVEDNLLNREMLVEILAEQYAVLQAENGQEALDVLKQRKDSIALILLDIVMPVMDGFTFLDIIKKDAELSLIPVIVMTQGDSEADEVSALSHGATDFVPKPYRAQVILHRVASLIKLRETAALINQYQYDRLTGLYSKDFFYQKVREKLDENPEQEYTIICSNIENFKLYNDMYGREAGDILLKHAAEALKKGIGKKGICGRYGADRFLCLQTREQELADRTRFFSERCAEHSHCGEKALPKWGIYEITDRSLPVDMMCDRALLAVNSIKGKYHKNYAVYDDTIRSRLRREQDITNAMETALEEGQFTVYFQPKYNLQDGSMAGAEALVRWIHPEMGFMSPGEFIPLFEKNGFITRLDQFVWEQVCACLKNWRELGYPPLPVSVNVSRAEFYQTDLAGVIWDITQKYGVKPQELHLEITESAYAENPDQIISMVEQLRKLGFVIEMDDFGSGYSSLSMLNQMKLDFLKLDMHFVQSETEKTDEQSILRFIVNLAHWMNLSVVAEGVETKQQLERLREIGCDYVQGYYFARPMPGSDYETLLQDQVKTGTMPPVVHQRQESALRNLLVVDDDASYRELVRKTFAGQYQVLEAADAAEALSCVRENQNGPVSAVILSATLPDEGAAHFLKHMRQEPRLWQIPVLATIPSADDARDGVMDLDTDDFLCKRHPLRDLRRRVEHLFNMANYQERERVLQDEAFTDYLTRLLNRRGFYAAVDAMAQEKQPLAMYLFDLDDLKKVNDGYGHEMGDQLLQFFGRILQRKTRDDDIVCRYGGDEFIVVLKRISAKEVILKKGADICRSLAEFQLPDGSSATCSCGIALCSAHQRFSTDFIEQADKALYQAKQQNKGGCCLWEAQ